MIFLDWSLVQLWEQWLKTVGLGIKNRKPRTWKGKGFVGNILGLLNPTIGTVAKTVGLGVKARKPRGKKQKAKKGKGVVSDISKSGVKALVPMLIDAASSAVKIKNSGMGAKKKRTTKRGRPRKSKTGAALMPAGY